MVCSMFDKAWRDMQLSRALPCKDLHLQQPRDFDFYTTIQEEKYYLNMAPSQLNFITGNKHKLAEVQAILGGAVDLQSRSIDLVEIQGTIEEISKDKCRRAAEEV
jgi:hypothetical protein